MTDEPEAEDWGKCRRARCGGPLIAMHIHRAAFEVGADGRWFERLADFLKDVDVRCGRCGRAPEGAKHEVDSNGYGYRIIPAEHHDGGHLATG